MATETLTIYLRKPPKKLSVTLKVPILYLMEFSGTDKDVKNVRKIVRGLAKGQSTKEVQKPKEMRGNISF